MKFFEDRVNDIAYVVRSHVRPGHMRIVRRYWVWTWRTFWIRWSRRRFIWSRWTSTRIRRQWSYTSHCRSRWCLSMSCCYRFRLKSWRRWWRVSIYLPWWYTSISWRFHVTSSLHRKSWTRFRYFRWWCQAWSIRGKMRWKCCIRRRFYLDNHL